MSDDCCGHDLERLAIERGLSAGDCIMCPTCRTEYVITEHGNGWQSWMTFAREIAL